MWRKLAHASLVGNLADPVIYLVGLGFGLGAFMPPIAGMYIQFPGRRHGLLQRDEQRHLRVAVLSVFAP